MKIALLTLEALASAAPVRRFVAAHSERIALVALSDPHRPQRGGVISQGWHLLRRSGPRLVPYLLANFELPRCARWLPGQAQTVDAMPLAHLCHRLGVPVATVPDMNAPPFHAHMIACGARILVTFHCDQILTAATIASLPGGGINVHAGLLPDHRGPVPTIHALLCDPPLFGVTVHRLVPQIDAGPILARARLSLPPETTALEAAERLHEAGVPLLLDVLDRLERGTATEETIAPKPYCGFPSAAQLRALARRGRSAASWRDIRRALRTPV